MKASNHFLLLLSLGTFFLFSACERTPKHATTIVPPFEMVHVPTQTFTVDASKASVLHLPKGGSINIPANAFTDAEGKVVQGSVNLEYKQMNSAAEIISSGIPMVCADDQGQLQQMQSAGMFDIKGSAAGKEVFIAKDKSLQVNMASQVQGDYDFFYLEQEESPQAATVGFIPEARAATGAPAPRVWWKKIPHKYSPQDLETPQVVDSFKLTYNTKDFPENKILQDLTWKLTDVAASPKQKDFEWALKETWDQVLVSKPIYKTKLLPSKYGQIVALPQHKGYIYNHKGEVSLLDPQLKTLKVIYKGDTNTSIHYVQHDLAVVETPKELRVYDLQGTFMTSLPATATLLSKDRAVYAEKIKDGLFRLILKDLKGNVIGTYEVHKNYLYEGELNAYNMYSLTNDGKSMVIEDDHGVRIYDMDGKLLAQQDAQMYSFWGSHRYHSRYLTMSDQEDKQWLWDWRANKIYLIEGANYIDAIHPTKTELTYGSNKGDTYEYFLYNWATKSRKLLFEKKVTHINKFEYDSSGHFLYNDYNYDGRTGTIFNAEGKELYHMDQFTHTLIHEKRKLALMVGKHESVLIDSKGKKWIDFKAFDSTLAQIYWIKDKIFAYNTSGSFFIWDHQQQLEHTYATGIAKAHCWPMNDSIMAIISEEQAYVSFYNMAQKRVTHQVYIGNDNCPLSDFAHELMVLSNCGENYRRNGDILLHRFTKEPLKESEYQLMVYNKHKSFSTYIYLSEQDYQKVQRYQAQISATKEGEEKRKAAEDQVIRSFEIQKFGIYNWDIFYHNEKEHLELALELELPSDIVNGHTEYKVFMVTGQEQNVVVKFTKDQLSGFKFWPSEVNQLLVVLPSGKLGHVPAAAFAQLDISAVKRDKKLKIKPKIYDALESQAVLEGILKGKKEKPT